MSASCDEPLLFDPAQEAGEGKGEEKIDDGGEHEKFERKEGAGDCSLGAVEEFGGGDKGGQRCVFEMMDEAGRDGREGGTEALRQQNRPE